MTTPTEEKTSNPETASNAQPDKPAVVKAAGNDFGEFITFRKFATPVLVQIAFWVGVLVCLGLGMNMIEGADQGRRGINMAMFWTGVLIIFLGPLVLRIAGELILVVFRINEQIEDLRKQKA